MTKKDRQAKPYQPMLVAGLMSGSSLDGLDVAICRFEAQEQGGISYEILHATTIAYESEWIEDLSNAFYFSLEDFFTFQADYSRYVALIVEEVCKHHKVEVDLVASHGHTLDHRPAEGMSLQIGDPAIMAAVLGVDCIGDFRLQDITLGGQGAPIIPIAEQLLWTKTDAFLNLGGIANISLHNGEKVLAWDSTPCNQVLNDQAMILGAEYDEDGAWAKEGTLSADLYAAWSNLPYFHLNIPKSLDNNWIKNKFLNYISELKVTPKDAMHTACVFMADRIAEDIGSFAEIKPKQIMVSGGGTYNGFLLGLIREKLEIMGIEVVVPEPKIIEYKEALMSALMGYLYLHDRENTIPSVTGASRATISGKYCKG